MKPYSPREQNQAILEQAWTHIESVPYATSARWLFYRLYQDGIYTNKGDYKSKFLPLLSKARKRFYGDWEPSTLEDDTRRIDTYEIGFENEGAWLRAVSRATCNLDRLAGQEAILAVLYEAKAMRGQFEHYIPNAAISCAFGGDPSIPAKWKLAELLAKRWDKYHVPVCVCYFGDYDPKGMEIEKAAKADILEWVTGLAPGGEFQWTRGGLDEEHVERYALPVAPDKAGYQWEALSDSEAREIIADATAGLVDRGRISEVAEREREISTRFQGRFTTAFLGGK